MASETEMRNALREIDRLAEAGLCQFSRTAKHEYLKDIRFIVARLGLQGGLVPPHG